MLTRSTTTVALFSLILLLVQCGSGRDLFEKSTDVVDVMDAGAGVVDSVAGEGGVEVVRGADQVDSEVGHSDGGEGITDAGADKVETLDVPDACTPSCEGVECGDDGCGGSCGECYWGYPCIEGTCVDGTCAKNMGLPGGFGWPCGSDDDCLVQGCVDWNGESVCTCACTEDECPEEWECVVFAPAPDLVALCLPECIPDCQGQECGDDGCGGSCGECSEGTSCLEGKCSTPFWIDPNSGLTWENPGVSLDWFLAKSHCQGLAVGGHTDWRMPTISELRSLIRGCPDTMPGGECEVTDSCVVLSCFDELACFSCIHDEGPADGCYWPDAMQGTCSFYWSASSTEQAVSPDLLPGEGLYWYIGFSSGRLGNGNGWSGNVRCVW